LAGVEAAAANPEVRWVALLREVARPFIGQDNPPRHLVAALSAEMTDRIGLGLRWSTSRRRDVRETVRSSRE
jgi:hypothetical protein